MSLSLSRRHFLTTSAVAAGALALDRAPAFAQQRELTFLSWNHFVPASDEELRKQAEAFSKQAGVKVRVDTIAHLQLPAKFAAEAAAQSGHDMILAGTSTTFLYENHLVDVGDLVEDLGKKYGGFYPFSKEAALMSSGWKAVPWFWISFPATYNMAHYKKAGLEVPKTWDEHLKQAKALKKQGNLVGIPISHCADANTTFWSVLWCYGAKVFEADGKTPAINSEQTVQVEICRELVRRCRELTRRAVQIERELRARVHAQAEPLLALPGCGVLTAAKLLGETAGSARFSGEAKLAMHAGAAPLPASSGARHRHRLSRSGNRQLNCALHRMAVTQGRVHAPAREYLARKQEQGHSRKEALRCLKRHLARAVYRTLRAIEEERMTSTNRPVAVPALT